MKIFINRLKTLIIMKKFRKFRQEPVAKEKKDKTAVYMSIFLGGLMILSAFGVFFWNPSSESDLSYGKFTFKSANNMWTTKINKKDVSFYLLPDQVSHLSNKQANQLLKNSQGIVLSFNPEVNETTKLQAIDVFKFEFVNMITNSYKEKKIGFAIFEKSQKSTVPVINCQNSSIVIPVVVIDYGNETNIKTTGDCIVVKAADEYGLLAVLDNLRYNLYGVFEEI